MDGGFYNLFHAICYHSDLGGFFLDLTQGSSLLYYPGPGVYVFSFRVLSVKRSTLDAKQLEGLMTVIPNFSSPYIERFLADYILLLTWSNPNAGA